VALSLACEKLLLAGSISRSPLTDQVAAISCGILEGTPILDLDYNEDSTAETDANFILTADGGVVEIQMTAEETPFRRDEMNAMFDLAEKGVAQLAELQRQAVKDGL
jgi:ribonuclease PH